ncbi:hypothetical protein SAMN05444358_11541 [Ruegeria halocynthiae]|uniref:Uncharacterized protein n=1 Tax=Ruegeria halocynthiae TaxID=985054 RepID=A0A1H3FIB9_9RHOB|nr:hypothetical protein SAMN05444358_11541 [Ruegeria halocynthiae]
MIPLCPEREGHFYFRVNPNNLDTTLLAKQSNGIRLALS